MPYSTVPVIGAESRFEVSDGQATPVWTEVPECIEIGEVGTEGEFVQATPISSRTHRYISGMKTPPDFQLKFNDVPGDADQAAFLQQAYDGDTVDVRVVYNNGRVAAFTLVLSGYKNDPPQGNSPLTVTVYGKQSGDPVYSEAP